MVDAMTRPGSTGESQFRFDGGSPWLNFAATVGGAYSSHPEERLASPADLDAWLDQAGLHKPPVTAEDLERARALRGRFRAVSEAAAAGDDLPSGDLEVLTELACHQQVSTREGLLEFATVTDAFGALALTALLDVTGPQRAHLTRCQDSDCAWVFLDTTGRRHWCCSRCGTRTRVRAHRARTARPSGADV